MKIYSPAAQTQNPTIKLLVVGEPGAGKTRAASNWPDVLYLNAEQGLLSVRDKPGVKAIDIAAISDIEEVKRALDQPPSVREKLFGGPIQTVVFDTLDEMARIIIRERLVAEKKLTMAIQDWGYLGDTMRNIVRGFRNIEDVNVIFNVHLKAENDSETGRTAYKPAIQGAFGDEVAGYVDMALLMQARTTSDPKTGDKKIVRFLRSFPDSQHPWVKDRSGSMPMEFPIDFETDYSRLCSAIFGETAEEVQAKVADVAALQAELRADAVAREKADAAAKAADEAERKAKLEEAKAKSLADTKAKQDAAKAKALGKPATAPTEPTVAPTPAQAPAAAPAAKKAAPKKAEAPAPKATPAPETAAEAPVEPAGPTAEELAELAEAAAIEAAELEAARVVAEEAEAEKVADEAAARLAAEEEAAALAEAAFAATEPEASTEEEIEVVENLPASTPESEPEPAAEEPAAEEPVETPVAEAVTPANGPAPAADQTTPNCAVCGQPVETNDYADLSLIRFKKYLCRKDFAAAKAAK